MPISLVQNCKEQPETGAYGQVYPVVGMPDKVGGRVTD